MLGALNELNENSDPFLGSATILSADDLRELGLSNAEVEELDTGGERQPGVALSTGQEPLNLGATTPQLDPPPAPIAALHDELEGDGEPAAEPEEPERKKESKEEAILKPFSRKKRQLTEGSPPPPRRRAPAQLEEGLVTAPLPSKHRGKPSPALAAADLDQLAASLVGIP